MLHTFAAAIPALLLGFQDPTPTTQPTQNPIEAVVAQPAASDHGEKIDFMMWLTIIVTGIVFLLTQVLLFWFAFKNFY